MSKKKNLLKQLRAELDEANARANRAEYELQRRIDIASHSALNANLERGSFGFIYRGMDVQA